MTACSFRFPLPPSLSFSFVGRLRTHALDERTAFSVRLPVALLPELLRQVGMKEGPLRGGSWSRPQLRGCGEAVCV
jgi:hypothetical protein